jgi:hypothetical protein
MHLFYLFHGVSKKIDKEPFHMEILLNYVLSQKRNFIDTCWFKKNDYRIAKIISNPLYNAVL